MILGPAKVPCGSCPYRRDTPSGIWAQQEYEKLPDYDRPTGEQPQSVFMCHQQDGHLCAGWCGTHSMYDNLGLRLAYSFGNITPPQYEKALNYTSPVPLYGSGMEAYLAGLKDVSNPSPEAERKIHRLILRGKATS